jgi:sugar phosphate isomerase/epimerase
VSAILFKPEKNLCHMKTSRRTFLKTSGYAAAGVALSGTMLSFCTPANREHMPFGLQLYTLRHVIGDDPQGVISQVADFGYRQIESYEGPLGMFWGMGNRDFKSFLDDLGITMISTHANVFDDLDRKVDELAEIGVENIVSPWIGPQDSLDDYRAIAEQFNQIGETVNNAGLKFAYHNHAYTFEEQEGELPQDVLMENTDPDLVEYQLDIYWVAITGEDPAAWFRRYPNRFTSCHVKDLANGDDPESTILGTGTIDYPSLLPVAKENGMKYFIVEQEAYTNTTPLDAVRENAEYMKNLEI